MTPLDRLRRWLRPGLSCQDVNQFLADYLDDALAPGLRRRFEAHLAACPGCRPYFEQYRQTVALLREQGAAPIEPPPELVEQTLAFLRTQLNGAW